MSSTYTDLVSERQAVMSALLQLGAHPAGMELFPATDEAAWELIQRVIDESDYYLLVIGGRYGSVAGDGLSYTEKEYDYATAQRKPVMAFLHQSPEKLPFESSEGDPAVREKLLTFRRRVEAAKHAKFWTSAEDVAGKIALSYSHFTRRYPSPGWVRGDAGDSAATLRKLTTAQERINELEQILQDRAVAPPPGASGLADADERLALTAEALIRIKNLVRFASTAANQSISVECSISWNELLSALGPAMLDEARQTDLSQRFQNAVDRINRDQVERDAAKWLRRELPAEEIDDPAAASRRRREIDFTVSVKTDRRDFETALLQLEALGLIQRGTRKRPISDHATYWTLTPWGRTRLIQLRAVRAGAERPPEEDAFEVDEPPPVSATTTTLKE